jgi:hypothetical protein
MLRTLYDVFGLDSGLSPQPRGPKTRKDRPRRAAKKIKKGQPISSTNVYSSAKRASTRNETVMGDDLSLPEFVTKSQRKAILQKRPHNRRIKAKKANYSSWAWPLCCSKKIPRRRRPKIDESDSEDGWGQLKTKKVSPDVQKYLKAYKAEKKKIKNTLINKLSDHLNFPEIIDHESQQLAQLRHRQDDLICAICLRYIAVAVTTKCGHAFCETCILEYLLVSPNCIICDKKLRHTRSFATCKSLDNIVEAFLRELSEDTE